MDGSRAVPIHVSQDPFPSWGHGSPHDQTVSWEDEKVLLGDGTLLPAHSDASSSPERKTGTALQPSQKAVFLKIMMVKQRTGLPDSQLQEYLKSRLRLLENDTKKATAVFSELSARLLSIHSEDHLIAVTFWTLEEIWKFITYYSLGFLNHSMENLLLGDCFWLSSPEEAAAVDVILDEECLNLVYRSLLIQEGPFFVFSPENVLEERPADNQTVAGTDQLKLVAPMPALGASGRDGLAKGFGEPLIPFHQWFLKANPDPQVFDSLTGIPVTDLTATGFATAVISHESIAPEEISFQEGDKIEIIGYFISCMQWFLGRHTSTGSTGFVQSSSVKTDGSTTIVTECPYLDFFKDHYSLFAKEKELSEDDLIELLTQTSHDNICSLYQIDAPNDIGLQNPPEQEASRSTFGDGDGPAHVRALQSLLRRKDVPLTEGPSEPFPPPAREEPPPSQQPRFCLGREGLPRPESFDALLLFLNREGYDSGFSGLYDPSFAFLHTLFHGYTTEEELVGDLASAREVAKRAKGPWALARLCYLLGRMSVRKCKLSQARVYFEEAMATIQGDFRDLHLTVSLYTNLTGVYLKQKNVEKCAYFLDKAASLLMGMATTADITEMASGILQYALKRALLGRSPSAEARACFLLARHHLSFKQGDEALPFLERLQLLSKDLGGPPGGLSASLYVKLGLLYSQKCLPYLALSCVKVASSGSSCPLQESFRSMDLVLRNAPKLHGPKTAGQAPPSQMAFYLRELLCRLEAGGGSQKLCGGVCSMLSRLYGCYRRYKEAIGYLEKALEISPPAGVEGTIGHFISLSWLYVLHQKNTVALDILEALAESAQSSPQQLGVIHNMAAVSWRRLGCPKRAVENYARALRVSRETGAVGNEAVALANLGILCLHLAAEGLGEHLLVRAVQLFSELPRGECGGPFVAALLRLGSCYASGTCKEDGRCCYEWAFLVAMETNDLEGQLQAVQHLCQFYSAVAPDPVQCVLYSEYQLTLVRKMSDKVMEGQVLETISHLYLSLGTERAYRSALDYIKRSLGIFIDLQAKEREALAWLQAGKIYYILRENELVDVYIQVAINAALGSQDPNLEMELLEASGDIFFNGAWEQEKAMSFYRDKALPLAVKAKNGSAELRLFNKLVGLLLTLQKYEECLGYAQTSLTLSVSSGNQLSERVAYHRLAVIHHRLGHCELAEHFFLKAVSLCPSPLEFDEEALYYVKVYLLLGDITFYDLKDPFDAAGYYHLALAAAIDLGNKKAQLKIYTRLAIIYHNFLIDRERSLFFYQKARAFANELKIHRINLSPDPSPKTTWATRRTFSQHGLVNEMEKKIEQSKAVKKELQRESPVEESEIAMPDPSKTYKRQRKSAGVAPDFLDDGTHNLLVLDGQLERLGLQIRRYISRADEEEILECGS